MRDYRYDHVHLRSANPSAMADFFEGSGFGEDRAEIRGFTGALVEVCVNLRFTSTIPLTLTLSPGERG